MNKKVKSEKWNYVTDKIDFHKPIIDLIRPIIVDWSVKRSQ